MQAFILQPIDVRGHHADVLRRVEVAPFTYRVLTVWAAEGLHRSLRISVREAHQWLEAAAGCMALLLCDQLARRFVSPDRALLIMTVFALFMHTAARIVWRVPLEYAYLEAAFFVGGALWLHSHYCSSSPR